MIPKISVIIPNYNHEKYLQNRIDSIINQSFKDFEIILLDDCSTDNSKRIIERYENHPKVSQIIYNTENSGSTFRQWQKGIALAKGDWILIAESDDISHVELLKTLYNQAITKDNIAISYCQSNKIDEKGQAYGTWKFWTDALNSEQFAQDFDLNGAIYIERFLLDRCTILNASAVLFNKKQYNNVGGVDEKIAYAADWNLWLKMLSTANIAFTATCLNDFRFHSQSVIGKRPAYHKMKYDTIAIQAYLDYLLANNLNEKLIIHTTHQVKQRIEKLIIYLYSLGYKKIAQKYEQMPRLNLSKKDIKSWRIRGKKQFLIKKIYYYLRYQKSPLAFDRNKIGEND